ncbi:MAG: peptidoglycan editing factor PgeF [Clostridia bacterium]
MQFKKLLKYRNIRHCFSLRPLDIGSNDTYEKIKDKANKNYKDICDLLNLDSTNIVRPYQTHTNNVEKVTNEIGIFPQDLQNIDGLITEEKNIILSLSFADCTPIYLYDKEKNIIGNIHSGWQGTIKKIAKSAIIKMKKEFNSNPKDIICVIGPTIRKCHFEVQEDVKNEFYNTFNYMKDIDKIIEFNKHTNSYFIDTVEINKELLKEEGILEENIIDSNICTYCNSNIIHSYRKEEKEAGRNTAIICKI